MSSKTPEPGQTLDELFAAIERHIALGVAVSRRVQAASATDAAPQGTVRNIPALGERYLADLTAAGRSAGDISGRRSILNKWVYPVIGEVLVADWGTTESEQVLNRIATESGSKWRLRDTGSTLSGLRHTAHKKVRGIRWLDPQENPLEDVRYELAPRSREAPSTTSRELPAEYPPGLRSGRGRARGRSLGVDAGHHRDRWLRRSAAVRALALRPWDVDFKKKGLQINGRWQVSASGARAGQKKVRVGKRVPLTKNGTRRFTPTLGSKREVLRRRVAISLGLDETTKVKTLRALIDAERERRAQATGDWRDFRSRPRTRPGCSPGTTASHPPRSSSTTRGTRCATRAAGRPTSRTRTCGTTQSAGGRPTSRRSTSASAARARSRRSSRSRSPGRRSPTGPVTTPRPWSPTTSCPRRTPLARFRRPSTRTDPRAPGSPRLQAGTG